MKLLEHLLTAIAVVALVGIFGLGLFWAGRSVIMVATASPVVEGIRTSMDGPVADAATTTGGAAEEAAAQTASADPEPAEVVQASAAPAGAEGADAKAGAKVFKKCKACHSADEKAKNKTGPALWSVVGRPVAAVEGFKYSDALKQKAGEAWDVAMLDGYLEDPKGFIPGNKMSFAGLKKAEDRRNVIAYLGQQSDTPVDAAALGFAAVGAAAGDEAAAADTETAAAEPEAVEIEPVPYPEGVTYRNPPQRSAEAQAEIDARVAALEALAPTLDYERARYHPLHFPPLAAEASSAECLVCHQEILEHTPRETSPAGLAASDTIAWYQTLDTYQGDQQSFHYRHLESDFAKRVMNLECSFCHKGNDPREESPDMVPTRAALSSGASPEFTLRKMVNPSETCLRCHGDFPAPEIMGLDGPWHEVRADMEYPEAPNGCLSCHAESFRTARHGVDYLNAGTIEQLAREGSSDTCYGCHGGRAWYRISYPYPRHPWPGMDAETPDWAVGRPTQSDPDHALPASE